MATVTGVVIFGVNVMECLGAKGGVVDRWGRRGIRDSFVKRSSSWRVGKVVNDMRGRGKGVGDWREWRWFEGRGIGHDQLQ